eukprot:9745059-Lingulodinium_polyedra.AAC.1
MGRRPAVLPVQRGGGHAAAPPPVPARGAGRRLAGALSSRQRWHAGAWRGAPGGLGGARHGPFLAAARSGAGRGHHSLAPRCAGRPR